MSRIYRDSLTLYSTLWCPYGVPIDQSGPIPGRNPNLSIGASPDLKRSDEQTEALPFSLAAFKPNLLKSIRSAPQCRDSNLTKYRLYRTVHCLSLKAYKPWFDFHTGSHSSIGFYLNIPDTNRLRLNQVARLPYNPDQQGRIQFRYVTCNFGGFAAAWPTSCYRNISTLAYS